MILRLKRDPKWPKTNGSALAGEHAGSYGVMDLQLMNRGTGKLVVIENEYNNLDRVWSKFVRVLCTGRWEK